MRRIAACHAFLFAALMLVVSLAAIARAWDFRPEGDRDLLGGRLARAFESHYDAVFPGRRFGVALWAAIDYLLFHEGRSGVVIGRNGWLFTDEEFRLDADAAGELERNLASIRRVHRDLALRNIRLLVAVVPAKARVYAEDLDGRAPPPLRRSLYTRVQEALRERGVASVDLLAPLEAAKKTAPTYLRTDTHWTAFGARIAAGAIARAADAGLPKTDAGAFRTLTRGARSHRGDLLNFLPLDPYFAFLLPPPERIVEVRTEAVARADAASSLLGDAPAAEVALVGTSYSAEPAWNFPGALEVALQRSVMNYAKVGAGPFAPMFSYLDSNDLRAAPPRLVIWEIPERYLPMPANSDAPGNDNSTADATNASATSRPSTERRTLP